MNQWLTIADAAKALKLSKRSVRRKIEDGSLQSRLQDGRRYVLIDHEPDGFFDGKKASPDSFKRLLLLYESVRMLKSQCEDRITLVEIFMKMPNGCGRTDFETWGRMYASVIDCLRDIENMVAEQCIKQAVLQQTYHSILALRETWIPSLAKISEEGSLEEEDKELFGSLLDHLRGLLVARLRTSPV